MSVVREAEGEMGPRDSGRWWLLTSEASKDTSGLGRRGKVSEGGRERREGGNAKGEGREGKKKDVKRIM